MQSMMDMLSVERIRLYELRKLSGKWFLSVLAWNEGGNVVLGGSLDERKDLHLLSAHPFYSGSKESLSTVINREVDGVYVTCIPLFMGQNPVALFELCRAEIISNREMDVVTGIITVFRNYLALLEDSQRDVLTGLLNRRTFDQHFSSLIASLDDEEHARKHAKIERRTYKSDAHWLAVIDVDHFKRVNDLFGHVYGDEVLILMANIMRYSFRSHDRLFRFGGEEFVVLMRNTAYESIVRKLELFRQHMAEYEFPQVGKVTVSIGFVQIHPGDVPAVVVGQADEALYYAKENGRNQIHCYSVLKEKNLISAKIVHGDAEFF